MFSGFMCSWMVISFSFWNAFNLRTGNTIPTVMLGSFDSKHFTKLCRIGWICNNIFQFGANNIFIPTNFNFVQWIDGKIIFFTWFVHVNTNRRTYSVDYFFTLNKIKIFTMSPSQVEHSKVVSFLRHINES